MKDLDSIHKPENGRANGSALPKQSVSLFYSPSTGRIRKILKLALALIIAAILVLASLLIARAVRLSDKIFVGKKLSFFQKIQSLLSGSNNKLIGEDLSQINILLLGIGGEGHEGPYLTDTIIIAQVRPDIGQVALTSIPRDYLISLPEGGGAQKINSAFAYGLGKNKNYETGGAWAREAAEKISGLAIPYFMVVDFAGFKKAVDQVNGIEVEVEKTFTDSSFPNDNFGYLRPVTFTAGKQTMDGQTALMFARSRHGNNGENSDFARGQRQQKIIKALKNKVLDLNLIKDSGAINRLLGIFADHFHTNLQPGELFRLYDLVKAKNIQTFLSLSLDEQTKLICPDILAETKAWVLVPCPDKTPKDIENFFKNAFTLGQLAGEKAVIWLADSSGDRAAYQKARGQLIAAGFTVFELAYSQDKLEKTLVYSLNQKPASAEFVKNILNAAETALPPPGVKLDKNKVDIVVILGGNQ